MDGDGKKPLKIAVLQFYNLNLKKGKEFTIKHFKKSVHRATVYRWLKNFDSTGNCDRKSGSRTGKATDLNDATRRKIKRMVNNKVGVSQRTQELQF